MSAQSPAISSTATLRVCLRLLLGPAQEIDHLAVAPTRLGAYHSMASALPFREQPRHRPRFLGNTIPPALAWEAGGAVPIAHNPAFQPLFRLA